MKNLLKIIGTVILFDLAFYPLLYFVLLPNTDKYSVNLAILVIQVLSCVAIGLWCAHKNRDDPVNPKRAAYISIAAGCFGLYYYFLGSSLCITLMDLIWLGAAKEYYAPKYFIRIFLCENLFDRTTVMSYMCLIVAYQLGRIRFSRRTNTP